MGPSHAMSGAAAWLAGSLVAEHYGYHQSPGTIAVGTVVCAGAALLPDLDLSGKVTANKGGATVAHTFGVLSLFVAEVVEKLSLGVYNLTKTRKDPDRHNGHRTAVHTFPFALLAWWLTSLTAQHLGRWADLAIVFLMLGLALRGLFAGLAEKLGWAALTMLAAFGSVPLAWFGLPGGQPHPVLGLAVGAGCVVHILGDWITEAGVPILWPILVRGRMWRMSSATSMSAGGKVERWVLRPLLIVTCAGSAIGLVVLPFLT